MLITLLFVSQVGCEWVEISQHHYRKPIRPNHFPSEAEETTATNRLYTNHSLVEHNWNRGVVHRVPVANIERIQLRSTIKPAKFPPDKIYHSEPNFNAVNKQDNTRYGEEPDDVKDVNNDKFADVRKIFRGNVKNTQPVRNATKRPIALKKPGANDERPKYNHTLIHPNMTKTRLKTDEGKAENTFQKVPEIQHVNYKQQIKRKPIVETQVEKNNFDKNQIAEIINNFELHTQSNEPEHVTNRNYFINTDGIIEFHKTPNMANIKRVQLTNSFVKTPALKLKQNENSAEIPALNTEVPLKVNHHDYNTSHQKTVFKTKIDGVDKNNEHFIDETTNFNDNKPTEPTKQTNKDSNDSMKDHEETNENVKKDAKSNSMETIVKFMKVVADTISRNSHRSVNSKVRYLHNLRDTLMANIEDRINRAWPDDEDEPKTNARRRRSTKASPRGHVEFPSSESALMTISFLTFAVFLIKLVLQIIQTYKNKMMMVTPAVVAAVGRGAFARHRDHA